MGRQREDGLFLLLAAAPIPLLLHLDHRVEANPGRRGWPCPSSVPVSAPGARSTWASLPATFRSTCESIKTSSCSWKKTVELHFSCLKPRPSTPPRSLVSCRLWLAWTVVEAG